VSPGSGSSASGRLTSTRRHTVNTKLQKQLYSSALGGDADTLACITGGIADAYYKGVPELIGAETKKKLPKEFVEIIEKFRERYME